MKKKILINLFGVFLLLYLNSCKEGSSKDKNAISTDPAIIAKGETAFNQKCSGCHNFRQDGIGPALQGITVDAPLEWIQHFIRDPKTAIDAGDQRAKGLFAKYHTVMPSFAGDAIEETDAIIAFLNTHQEPVKHDEADTKALKNPIPGPVAMSDLVVDLKLVTQVPPSSDSGRLPLTRITKLDYRPGDGGSFVLDLRGKLYKLQKDQPSLYMDMALQRPKFINVPGLATGFGSFAFHPDFARNGLLYTTHTEPAGSAKADYGYADSINVTLQWVLTEWKADQPGAGSFSGKGRELLRVNFVSGIHGVQEITFNPLAKKGDADYGLLYIGIGDGGCTENGYAFLAHSTKKIWGTILRIDPAGRNSTNGQYGVPSQNPFVKNKQAGELGEIYAYGFRNPHRITWSHTGQMLVCNVGHGNIESVNMVLPGHDYGWPIREGNFLLNPYGDLNKIYPLPPDDSNFHITYPVAEYDHDEGKAISGGFEYTGTAVPALRGKYLFGDIPTGRLFYVDMTDITLGKQAPVKEWQVAVNGSLKTLHTLCGTDRVDLHFGKDNNGELYILTKPDGKIYRMTGVRK